MGAEQKLQELGLELGPVGTPVANLLPAVRTGNLLFGTGINYDVDPIPQACWIHNNSYENNGRNPAGIVVDSGFDGADLLWDVTGYDNSWDETEATKLPPILPEKDWTKLARLANWRLWRFLTRVLR